MSTFAVRAALAAKVRTSGAPIDRFSPRPIRTSFSAPIRPSVAERDRLIALAGELLAGRELAERAAKGLVDRLEGRREPGLAARLQDADDDDVGLELEHLRRLNLDFERHEGRLVGHIYRKGEPVPGAEARAELGRRSESCARSRRKMRQSMLR